MRVTIQAGPDAEPRTPLSRVRVLRAAVKIADERGIESLTMRRLAEEIGPRPCRSYYHVAKKNDVVDRIEVPAKAAGWKTAIRQRILSAGRRRPGSHALS